MSWNSVETLPENDQMVFVINCEIKMTPVKAFFSSKQKEFLILEDGSNCLNITHWSTNLPSPL
jgi:hypothetical protein